MRLILARHGNTFSPGDKPYWVGKGQDLPLVAEGIAQAERLGAALAGKVDLSAIYYAPLKRTTRFAEEVAKKLQPAVPLLSDDRLSELDYGQWGGLTDAEIVSKFGQESLSGWAEKCIWPPNCDWSGSAEEVEMEVRGFTDTLRSMYQEEGTVLAVTSNGRLRYFLNLDPAEFERRVTAGTFKVATGRVCVISFEDESFHVKSWNEEPGALFAGTSCS